MRQLNSELPVQISSNEISTRFWTFGMASGSLFARNVVLSDSGKILHYENANESTWSISGQELILISRDGRVSAKLAQVPSAISDRIRFEGEHVLGGPSGIILALQETELSYPVYFRWTGAIERFIQSVPFYLAAPYRISGIFLSDELVCITTPVTVEPYASLPQRCFLSMGAFSYCHGSFAGGETSVGRYCSIAAGARPFGPSHPMERISTSLFSYDPFYQKIAADLGVRDYVSIPYEQEEGKITIEHDVWIGEDVMIKRGVTVGTGSVIGARSVVTKDVPPYFLVAGVPAKTIRPRFSEAIADALLASRWWRFKFCDLPRSVDCPQKFISALQRDIDDGTIHEWLPKTIDVAACLVRVSPDD